MGLNIDIPDKYIGSYFGDVKTCVWFEATPNNGYFSLDFSVQRNSAQNINLQVVNSPDTITVVWQKMYEYSSSPNLVEDYVTIYHNPLANSKYYSIQNI